MPKRRSTGLTKRDMFNSSHGVVGKGDATRVSNLKTYHQNLSEVDFPGVEGLERRGTKLVKRYGPAPVMKLAEAPAGFVH